MSAAAAIPAPLEQLTVPILDPRFVDVICRRWQELTGQVPVRDGQSHDFLAEVDEDGTTG